MGTRRIKGKVGVGDMAPDFTLPSQSGEGVSLRDFLGKKRAIVLFFYPKDDTPACTTEACSFRNDHELQASRHVEQALKALESMG